MTKKKKDRNSEMRKHYLGCGSRLLLISGLVLVVSISLGFYMQSRPNLFEFEEIHQIAKRAVGLPLNQALTQIGDEIHSKYPKLSLPFNKTTFCFVNAGNWMGGYWLLHASLHEYVLLFGTPIGTNGHSGRYWGDIIDIPITGEFWHWNENGTLNKLIYKPGEVIPHPRWSATQFYLKPDTFMVEYARGFIPAFMPFALADTILSTQDFITLWKSLQGYAQLIWMGLKQGHF